MEEKYFYLDCLEGYYFKGYDTQRNWNGWSVPTFKKETCEEIIRLLKENDCQIDCVFLCDKLILFEVNGDELDRFEYNITNRGTYALGGYNWTWSSVSEKGLKEMYDVEEIKPNDKGVWC